MFTKIWLKLKFLDYKYHLFFAFLIRIGLIFYGSFHDAHSSVPYTDIDYKVFTDASRHIVNGQSPYDRHTYRYTPLIAIFLIPNLFLYDAFGKILFSGMDIMVGIIIKLIVKRNLHEYQYYMESKCVKNENNMKFIQPAAASSSFSRKSFKQKAMFSKKQLKSDVDVAADVSMFIWLYNPITIAIATRGNCDSIAGFLVLLTLYCLQCKQKYFLAGVIHGLAIHVRLYPIAYSLALFMYLSKFALYSESPRCTPNPTAALKAVTDAQNNLKIKANKFLKDFKNTNDNRESANKCKIIKEIKNIENEITQDVDNHNNLQEQRKTVFKKQYLLHLRPNSNQIRLISGCLLSLISLTAFFYYLYGYKFIHETYIFHLVRKDTRHNFSVYFYLQYLTAAVRNIGIWQKVLTVLPQIILLLVFSVRYGLNKLSLNFSILTQTVVMVAYNTVLTSQYFVWIVAVLPLCLWQIQMAGKTAVSLIFIWFAAQGAWLLPAYLLEFHGQNTFMFIWLQSVSLFCAHMAILGRLIMHFMPLKPEKKLL